MSAENVNVRKQLSAEQERWRAAERWRTKQDQRRQREMERKSDDVHALRYRCGAVDRGWSFCSLFFFLWLHIVGSPRVFCFTTAAGLFALCHKAADGFIHCSLFIVI